MPMFNYGNPIKNERREKSERFRSKLTLYFPRGDHIKSSKSQNLDPNLRGSNYVPENTLIRNHIVSQNKRRDFIAIGVKIVILILVIVVAYASIQSLRIISGKKGLGHKKSATLVSTNQKNILDDKSNIYNLPSPGAGIVNQGNRENNQIIKKAKDEGQHKKMNNAEDKLRLANNPRKSDDRLFSKEMDRYEAQKCQDPVAIDDFEHGAQWQEKEQTRSYKLCYDQRPYYGGYPYCYYRPSESLISWPIGWWRLDYYWWPGSCLDMYPYRGWGDFYSGWLPGIWHWHYYPRWYGSPYIPYHYGYSAYYHWRNYYYSDWSCYYQPKTGLSTIHKASLQKSAYFKRGEGRVVSASTTSTGRFSLNQSVQPSQPGERDLSPSLSARETSTAKIYPSRLNLTPSSRISTSCPALGRTSSNFPKQTITRPSRSSPIRPFNPTTRGISRSSLTSSGEAISRPSRLSASPRLSTSTRPSMSSRSPIPSALSVSPQLSASPSLKVFPELYVPSQLSSPSRLSALSRIKMPKRSIPSPSFSRPLSDSFLLPPFGTTSLSPSRPPMGSRPVTGSIKRR